MAVLLVGLAAGALFLLSEAVADAIEDRERERVLIEDAVTTTARVVSVEPSCESVPARIGGAGRCRIGIEFVVPGEELPVRTSVGGTGRSGETVTVTYRSDDPLQVLQGANLPDRIASDAHIGVVVAMVALALAVTGLRPLPDPSGAAELHRTRSVVTVPLLIALTMPSVAVIVGLGWGISLVVALALLLSELNRRHDRLVIGFDEITQRRWWRGTQRLLPDRHTTLEAGARWQAAGALVLTGPHGKITMVPWAWQDPARVADRLLRVLPAADATIEPDVAARLWALRGGR